MPQQLKVKCGLICDDARIESNNKVILIGIYAGAILVSKFPAQLRLSCWLHGQVAKTGKQKVQVRLRVFDKSGKKKGEAKGPVNLIAKNDLDFGIAVTGMLVKIEGPGRIQLDYLPEGGKGWRKVIEKKIGVST